MDLWKINYSAVQNYGKKNIFLVSTLIKKVREEKGKIGGLFERGRIFGKNIPNNSGMMYLLFNGKRRNLARCLLSSSFLLGSETL